MNYSWITGLCGNYVLVNNSNGSIDIVISPLPPHRRLDTNSIPDPAAFTDTYLAFAVQAKLDEWFGLFA